MGDLAITIFLIFSLQGFLICVYRYTTKTLSSLLRIVRALWPLLSALIYGCIYVVTPGVPMWSLFGSLASSVPPTLFGRNFASLTRFDGRSLTILYISLSVIHAVPFYTILLCWRSLIENLEPCASLSGGGAHCSGTGSMWMENVNQAKYQEKTNRGEMEKSVVKLE